MSALGGEFPRERFLRTPIPAIMDLLKFLDNEERRVANIQSATASTLTYQIVALSFGLGGSKPPESIDHRTFLPFPDWKPDDNIFEPETEFSVDSPSTGGSTTPPAPSLKATLISLLRQQRIPMHVYVAISQQIK